MSKRGHITIRRTGDYNLGARWELVPIEAAVRLEAPTPLFRKHDEWIVEEDLARLAS